MDDYWERKVDEVIKISKEYGYKELNKEFWINQPAILISLVVDIYKSKKKIITVIEKRLEQILEEEEE